MFRLSIIIVLFIAVASCKSVQNNTGSTTDHSTKVKIEESDSVEYELIVFDPTFETYIQTLPYPMDYYSEDYYKSWNMRYVEVWNYRHSNPLQFGDFYDTIIYYDAQTDYGVDLNFRLYHYFLFIEKRYGITLIKRPRISQ